MITKDEILGVVSGLIILGGMAAIVILWSQPTTVASVIDDENSDPAKNLTMNDDFDTTSLNVVPISNSTEYDPSAPWGSPWYLSYNAPVDTGYPSPMPALASGYEAAGYPPAFTAMSPGMLLPRF